MSTATVYQVETADQANSLKVTEIARPVGDWNQYASLSTATVGNRVYLLGFKAATGVLDVYEFTVAAPWAKVTGAIQVGVEKDIVNTFTLGNHAHIAVYKAKNGIFEIYALGDDLSLSAPLQYYRNHEPAITKKLHDGEVLHQFRAGGHAGLRYRLRICGELHAGYDCDFS